MCVIFTNYVILYIYDGFIKVIMGYVGTTHEYLEYGIRALKGGDVLHFHETVPSNIADTRPRTRIEDMAKQCGCGCEILGQRMIKKYSPGVEHVVVDARITEKG